MRPTYESEILYSINKAGMAMGYNVVDANGCQQTGKDLSFFIANNKIIKNYVFVILIM